MKDKLLTIFNTYGKSQQASKLLEEVGEFIETIMNEDKENMVQEIADVLNMVEQFMYYYDIDIRDVIEIKHQKIDRTISRIEEGYYDRGEE